MNRLWAFILIGTIALGHVGSTWGGPPTRVTPISQSMSIGAYPLGWIQSNADGFGDPENILVAALASFAGSLYAGTYNSSTGAQL